MKHVRHTLLRTPVLPGAGASFVRGFIAGGSLSAFQDRPAPDAPHDLKRVFRHALQSGTALTAGEYAATAFRRGNYMGAMTAAAAGAAGVCLIERLLRDATPGSREKQENQEKTHG